jgi:hypothetical protein
MTAERTKLARSGSSFKECEPVIDLVYCQRCEEIGSCIVLLRIPLWQFMELVSPEAKQE